jgi:hypothetical protein
MYCVNMTERDNLGDLGLPITTERTKYSIEIFLEQKDEQ